MVHQHLHTPSIQVNDITTAFRAAAAGHNVPKYKGDSANGI